MIHFSCLSHSIQAAPYELQNHCYISLPPNPRDIDPLLWARIVHAAHHLRQEDFPDKCYYPLPMVKALALLWCYGALRVNEIQRLRVGCIRWQREDLIIPETGEQLSKDATCFLTIPFDKSTPAFSKAINCVVGKAINAWEALRPRQPRLLDPKTNELVDFLFAYRGRQIAPSYLNTVLISLLCDRAGIPASDEQGAKTRPPCTSTHRNAACECSRRHESLAPDAMLRPPQLHCDT